MALRKPSFLARPIVGMSGPTSDWPVLDNIGRITSMLALLPVQIRVPISPTTQNLYHFNVNIFGLSCVFDGAPIGVKNAPVVARQQGKVLA
jgi:hypothetical protein